MKGGYLIVAALAAMVLAAFAVDHPIRPIPTTCPVVDSLNYTVHLRHSDCTKFYKCSNGNPIEMSCPKMNEKGDLLHFNPLLQVCDFPDRAGCTGTTKPVEVDPTPPSVWDPTWDCSTAKDGSLIPHKTRCYLFYRCINHIANLETCPEGLSFDPYRQTCTQPSVSQCVVKNVCKDYKSNVGRYIPDPESCKYVYFCKGTTTTHYPCDVDAEWSVDVEKCVAKEKAHCVRRFYK